MSDVLTQEQRSRCMSNIKGKDTKPEMFVRRLVHAMGYRYRLHRRDLPGTPDLVFPKHRKVIFVHGCYWHRHNCPEGQVRAKTNSEFWENKIQGNVARDLRNQAELERMGWQVLLVWECWTKDPAKLESIIKNFLSASPAIKKSTNV